MPPRFNQKPAVTEEELPPPAVAIGDKVTRSNSDTVYEVTYVSASGREANLSLPGINLERTACQSANSTA